MNGPDRHEVARAFGRVATTYAGADFLHAEVRSRLLGRLDVVSLEPERIVDLGAGPPEATEELAARYPEAQVLAIDLVPAMLGPAARGWDRVTGDAQRLPLADASVDLVFANMLLHWCSEPGAVLAEVSRVLRFPAVFVCTTLGTDTLRELRSAWGEADRSSHTLPFTEMHDLGDALVRAGFAEPVVDTETITVTYRDLDRLVADLRSVAATDLGPARRRTLTGPARWQRMSAAYEAQRDASGVLPVTLEIIYVQAWASAPDERQRGHDGEFVVPLERIRRR